MIKTKFESFENYGKVICISAGDIEVKVTLDIGPRVIYLAGKNKKNLFFCDIERSTNCDKKQMHDHYGEGRNWYLYGGYRLWMSPESLPETYYPDNDPVKYEIDGNKITFIPKPQTENGLQTLYSLEFKDNGCIRVENVIKNISAKPVKGAVWGLCVMNKNSLTFAAQNDEDTGLLPNRTLVLWPYTRIDDKRLVVRDGYLSVKQDPDSDCALKVGFNNTEGKIYTYLDGEVFIQSYETDHKNGEYPDGGCSCEIYSCPDFTEAEILSPLKNILPGDDITFGQTWEIMNIGEDLKVPGEIESYLKK